MTSEDIIKQRMNAYNLSLLMEAERSYDDVVSILNLLSIAGYKLVPLAEEDFDEEGVSLVSKAYMYAVAENVEGSHYNLAALKEEKNDLSEFEDQFDDDIDEGLWDDLGDDD